MTAIRSLHARQILDSRGKPTVEVDVTLESGHTGRAAVPSGASTGTREAVELRDGDPHRYSGQSVLHAIKAVHEIIAPAINGMDAREQRTLDARLCSLDGTPKKSKLGANAILGVSMAVARAAAAYADVPLFHHLAGGHAGVTLPVPMFNVVNGGVHADNNVDMQEFMIAPVGASSFQEAVRMGVETYQALKSVLKKKGYSTAVGDEGGFAPHLRSNDEAIEVILLAFDKAGLAAERDIVIALDPASSEFFDKGSYVFAKSDGSKRIASEMVDFYEAWVKQYPIWSLEDGLAEDDWEGWAELTRRLGGRLQLVGDDIFVTDPATIRKAVQNKIGNAALIKLNQIGSVTETFDAMTEAKKGGFKLVISHRSGETYDDFMSHLAVAAEAGQLKSGAPCRGERVAKYNELMRIEEELGAQARFAGRGPFESTPRSST